jgi:ammonia channel protein AmtB
MIGLMGATALGPRLGKYARDGRPRPIAGHNLVYVVVGSLLLAAGWFGFNIGPSFSPPMPRARRSLPSTRCWPRWPARRRPARW